MCLSKISPLVEVLYNVPQFCGIMILSSNVTDMNRRDRAFMEQIKPRFTPSGPPILQLLKCKQLERTMFMQELRAPHSCASYSSVGD